MQVPARISYLSDGPTRQVKVGRLTIRFKHARPKQMGVASPASALVIQALRHLGEEGVIPEVIQVLRTRLSKSEQCRLVRDTRLSSDWIHSVARQIAKGTG